MCLLGQQGGVVETGEEELRHHGLARLVHGGAGGVAGVERAGLLWRQAGAGQERAVVRASSWDRAG